MVQKLYFLNILYLSVNELAIDFLNTVITIVITIITTVKITRFGNNYSLNTHSKYCLYKIHTKILDQKSIHVE